LNVINILYNAELCAQRHLDGGIIGFTYNYQGLQGELMGRSGGPVHIGFERPFRKDRTPEQQANDMAIIGWQRAPFAKEEARLKALREKGIYILGFGPANMPELAAYKPLCDAWFDTGYGADDRVVTFGDGEKGGRANLLVNALYGWCFIGEFFGALTRHGKVLPMWKAYAYEDGPEWGNRYLGKMQFHDEFDVPPLARGEVAARYLDRIRYHVRKFKRTQQGNVDVTARLILDELAAGRKTVVAAMGHMAWTHMGHYEDLEWGERIDLHSNIERQVKQYIEKSSDGALVLRMGYCGMDSTERDVFTQKKQRVMLVSAETPRGGEFSTFLGSTLLGVPGDVLTYVDMGYAFGDACVAIKGYPIRILPPSGIMQLVAYECINVETLSRLHAPR